MKNGSTYLLAGSIARKVTQVLGFLNHLESAIALCFKRVIAERNERAKIMNSEEIKEAVAIAARLFVYLVTGVLCFDGRFGPAVKYGFPGGFGKFLRYPAGDLREFVRSATKKGLKLLRNSDFAKRLGVLAEEFDSWFLILDSHLFCAARMGKEGKAGRKPADHGLFRDVVRKREIGEAAREYMKEFHSGKEVIPIQVSYNPHNGKAFMGLETVSNLDEILAGLGEDEHALENALKKLAEEGKIISTGRLQKESPFKEEFAKNIPESFDPKRNYAKSMLGFWRAVDAMHTVLIPEIVKRLEIIYPGLDQESKEMRGRAMLLLANAFISYLNNLHDFDYSEHTEEIIVVTEREYGPYETMSFPVFSLDLVNLARDVVFAAEIVRLNRSTRRIQGNTEDPVPVLVQEIVRDKIDEKVWEGLQEADFSSLLVSKWWENSYLADEAFRKQLRLEFPHIPLAIADALVELRRKMAVLYDPTLEAADNFTEGNLVAIPTIVDRRRYTRLVLPLVLKGY